jgi:DNA-binding NarL/FixJ family response regulator
MAGLAYRHRHGRRSRACLLSPRTVQNHVQNTLIKLQLHNKAQLVRYALGQGIE